MITFCITHVLETNTVDENGYDIINYEPLKWEEPLYDNTNHDVSYDFNLNDLKRESYCFDIKAGTNLIYSSRWNETQDDFVTYEELDTYQGDKQTLLRNLNNTEVTLHIPFQKDSHSITSLVSIKLKFDVKEVGNDVFQHRLINIIPIVHTHTWLPKVVDYDIGVIDKIDESNVPFHLLYQANKFGTEAIQRCHFTTLWLYPYHTGDIFLVNLEKSPTGFQYYVASHLHIENNECGGQCHQNCVVKMSPSGKELLRDFLYQEVKHLKVIWFESYCRVIHTGGNTQKIIITQDNNCATINLHNIDSIRNPNSNDYLNGNNNYIN